MPEQDDGTNSNEKPKVRKLEAVNLKNEKSQKITPDSAHHDEDDDLTRELLELYQIPFRRRKPEGI